MRDTQALAQSPLFLPRQQPVKGLARLLPILQLEARQIDLPAFRCLAPSNLFRTLFRTHGAVAKGPWFLGATSTQSSPPIGTSPLAFLLLSASADPAPMRDGRIIIQRATSREPSKILLLIFCGSRSWLRPRLPRSRICSVPGKRFAGPIHLCCQVSYPLASVVDHRSGLPERLTIRRRGMPRSCRHAVSPRLIEHMNQRPRSADSSRERRDTPR